MEKSGKIRKHQENQFKEFKEDKEYKDDGVVISPKDVAVLNVVELQAG